MECLRRFQVAITSRYTRIAEIKSIRREQNLYSKERRVLEEEMEELLCEIDHIRNIHGIYKRHLGVDESVSYE